MSFLLKLLPKVLVIDDRHRWDFLIFGLDGFDLIPPTTSFSYAEIIPILLFFPIILLHADLILNYFWLSDLSFDLRLLLDRDPDLGSSL